ncbi:MAG: acylneuraminate cytidylyltransferase family protein [Myxococcota bacterium]
MSTVAIVPARGGSKNLPRKNLALLGGHPLVAWSIRAALASDSVDRVVVSSDDEEILTVGSLYGAEPIARPRHLATDVATSEGLVIHALDMLGSKSAKFETVVLLQPTSPLRTDVDVDAALELRIREDADAVISVYEPTHSPFKAFYQDPAGHLCPVAGKGLPFVSRQSLPRAYMPNGAIYVVQTAEFRRRRQFLGERTLPYVMPIERSIDIDDEEDLRHASRVIDTLGLSLPRFHNTPSMAAKAARESVAALEFLEESVRPGDLLDFAADLFDHEELLAGGRGR